MKQHPASGAIVRARHLRAHATDAERKLWRALREALPAHHFRRQVPIGPYIVDFVCHAVRLVIELDGGQHAERVEYDAIRSRFLEAEGYRVLRFWNNDALLRTTDVLATIEAALNQALPIEGRGVMTTPWRTADLDRETP